MLKNKLLKIITNLIFHVKILWFNLTNPSKISYFGNFSNINFISGTQYALIMYDFGIMSKGKRKILSSAIKHPSGIIFTADRGCRHHQIIQVMSTIGVAGIKTTKNQGFIDNYGYFYNRTDALRIAKMSNQIIDKTKPKDRLFSEDIWETVDYG